MIREFKHILLSSNKPILIADEFAEDIDLFCKYLKLSKLEFFVTSSFRNTTIIPGAIVPPAKRSNHLVGCAIDGNLIDSKRTVWTTKKLREGMSDEVRRSFTLIRTCKSLRWGGDFSPRDEVHFDNGLNIKDPENWNILYDKYQSINITENE